MEDAVGDEKEPTNLTLRILGINFGAIHTTSMVSRFFFIFIPLAQLSRVGLHICSLPVASSVSHVLKTTQRPHDIYQSRIHTASPE
jgi:hypothetical protein